MKNITQLVFKPKKSAAAKGVARPGTIWFDNDDQDEIDALSTLAIKKAGFKRSDFFKPVRVDHLVVDDMPAEGVFDTAFCDRYKLAEDGKSWLLPAAQSESGDSDTTDTSNQGQGNEDATSITDSGDTASSASSDAGTTTATDSDSADDTAGSADTEADASTESPGAETVDGDELPAYAYNVNGEPLADVEKSMLHPVATLSERHRILSQFILEDKFSHQITPEQLAEVIRLELDVSGNYIQDMLLATRNAPAIHKFNTPDLWKYTDSFKKVFARDKRHPLSRMINFDQAYADAHPIDRGLLVQDWIKGNYISRVEKSGATSVSAVPEPQKTSATKADVAVSGKPATKTTYKAIDIRIGRALAKEAVTYPIVARDVEQGKAIVEADGEEFKRWSATYRITENIQFYDEKTHIEMIRQAPREVVTGSPELRRAYVDNYLSAYGTLDPDQMMYMPKRAPVDHKENMERVRKAGKNLRDIAAGRFNCDEEKPQSEDVLADKPSAPETVEPDENEHHPDTRSMATESSVTADSDKTPREQFSEQLAADRGDFVPGISDPSDPKWMHNDYSASNEGEKAEVDTDDAADAADYVDHSEEFSNQTEPEASHSEPSADQNEPESPETKLKSLQPEPVTKVADGVFDVSAFFADTSNQGEKTEVTPPNNDDRSHECAEEKTTDAPATTESLLHEIVRLQSINNQLLEEVISGQQREVRWKEDVMDSLFAGIRGFARTFTVRGMRTKGRDNGEKLHKSEKG
ncbi:hypothetical protein FVI83_17310 [Salmonella enterica subsp. diarizonae]|nr:hypothetical protein [Salmonella enterica subsp. diarizonae]ECJ5865360.1 hypothetical protein [Salmonella enterica subsp. diarizonae]EEB6126584.1 hypothetical protein [Salmonella enterica subsp. diarizonae]